MIDLRLHSKWLVPGIGVKRWLLALGVGVLMLTFGLCIAVFQLRGMSLIENTTPRTSWLLALLTSVVGFALMMIAPIQLSRNIVAPYRAYQPRKVVDVVYAHSRRQRGLKVVTIGGGTGLPSVLRGIKPMTSNITAVVTVADDGGSSGRLRREMGVLPPGDLRNNIAALADDESLMTHLFQYRFRTGDLDGHSFGNLFITAMAEVTGSIEQALIETERVLNIQGRVLPSTLNDVSLVASVRLPGKARALTIRGESKITEVGGRIEKMSIDPPNAQAYSESVQAILDADLIIIGPGSLYTSILPNLLVQGIADALRATNAYKIYICNVAQQPGETDDYTVAEHVMALEEHIGRGVFQTVLANNAYPIENAGVNTRYVGRVPDNHEVGQRYRIRYTDLTDFERPWRHDPHKLANAILNLSNAERLGNRVEEPMFA